MQFFGIRFACAECLEHFITKDYKLPEFCTKCRSQKLEFRLLIRFEDFADKETESGKIMLMENRISRTMLDLEKMMSQLRERFKSFLTRSTSSAVKTS